MNSAPQFSANGGPQHTANGTSRYGATSAGGTTWPAVSGGTGAGGGAWPAANGLPWHTVAAPAWYAPAGLAARFDTSLGDPADPDGEFSAARCAELDRLEAFPAAICRQLDSLALPSYYVPAELGGRLTTHEDLIQLVRCLARRDLTVAVAHTKTFLGAVPVWIGGDVTQAVDLADQVIAGTPVCWALSEPGHGADLLADEVTARRSGSGYLLDGEKWPVNNATRGRYACVLARTGEAGGSRGFSLLLVDKAALAPGAYLHLAKARTHGIRGADISGIAFAGAALPATALISAPGSGLEIVLRALQLTRTMCTALSLGAGEHALRLATEFTAGRIIGGKPLIDRPAVRAVLARSAAVLLAAEATTVIASRSIHALTGEMSVISAVVKALLPTLVDRMIGELGELLGARSFLDGVYADGAFQKLQRDHRIVGIFDGATAVNRNSVISQFPRLARGFAHGLGDAAGLAQASRIASPVPPFNPRDLRLFSSVGCSVVQLLPAAADRVAAAAEAGRAPAGLATAARMAVAATADLHRTLAGVRAAARPAAASFELAGQYEICFAMAACLHLWEAGHRVGGITNAALWEDALWTRACLRELTGRLGYGHPAAARARADMQTANRLVDWLAATVAAGEGISIFSAHRPAGAAATISNGSRR